MDLSFDEKDRVAQEDFTIVEKTLTLSEAKSRQSDPYMRQIIQRGFGNKARLISENEAIISGIPNLGHSNRYKVGIGDTIVFSKLINKIDLSAENQSLLDKWEALKANPNENSNKVSFVQRVAKLNEITAKNQSKLLTKSKGDYRLGVGDQLTLFN